MRYPLVPAHGLFVRPRGTALQQVLRPRMQGLGLE